MTRRHTETSLYVYFITILTLFYLVRGRRDLIVWLFDFTDRMVL
jgi:hypothetical protein